MKHLLLILVTLVEGWLGAYAGADKTSKNWRRIGVPAIVTIIAYFVFNQMRAIFLMTRSIVLSMGYGCPDSGDEGSGIGKYWYEKFKGDKLKTNTAIRATIGTLERSEEHTSELQSH